MDNPKDVQFLIEEIRELNHTNKEIVNLLKLMAKGEINRLVGEILPSTKERKAYELTDGINTTREIAKIVGSGKNTISRWWKKWADLGIAETSGDFKPYKAKYSSVVELALEVGSMSMPQQNALNDNNDNPDEVPLNDKS